MPEKHGSVPITAQSDERFSADDTILDIWLDPVTAQAVVATVSRGWGAVFEGSDGEPKTLSEWLQELRAEGIEVPHRFRRPVSVSEKEWHKAGSLALKRFAEAVLHEAVDGGSYGGLDRFQQLLGARSWRAQAAYIVLKVGISSGRLPLLAGRVVWSEADDVIRLAEA